ncbi:bifunctional UDP-N-acetylglucosamine diphosphorylase/glucosamine-1-phosphate N-acetyltransferase GlmU [Thioalkalicoccus limnaeus]|uniref:Bifunctional protein GlmU n=1 Tax=Thioalkalicoccus limnaeus TaxID=120681 RepID=A0ABV4BD98_9GAMM
MMLGVALLAAGQGKRMRSAWPKVLHRLAGRPLLAHAFEAASSLQPERICIVYGHGGDLVRSQMSELDCVWVEQAEQLGTGHAVRQAMIRLADLDRVLVLYGDVPLIEPETLARLVALAEDTSLALLTVRLADPTGYGRIVRDRQGRVQRIVEHGDASAEEQAIDEVNTGILIADRARLNDWLGRIGTANAQREYYLTDVIGLAVEDGVAVATTAPARHEEVAGVNDRIQLAQLERLYQRRLAEDLMRDGVALADPARLDIRGRLLAERDSFIDVNVVVEGEVRLGEGARIGPNCLLRDSVIGAGSEILANSVLEGARIGVGARVGPFARLRPGTELGDASRVGNFVEIKKSAIGSGSKVNHLSYIGDARIGSDVNIGAGTITCNYDGAAKHETRIGDGAFIGSNSALVAPVEVGPGATIGAGSVITRDAPPECLTLARGRQVTLDNWVRPRKPSKKP